MTRGCANADRGRKRFVSVGGFPLKPCRCFQLSLVCFRHSISLDQQAEVNVTVNGSSVVLSLCVYVRVVAWVFSGRGTATALSFSALLLIPNSSWFFFFLFSKCELGTSKIIFCYI